MPAVLVALVATACQVRTTVGVDVAEDGSGTVEVAVGLDADAVGRLPDLDGDGRSTAADLGALVRTDDLRAAGWDIGEPTEITDGGEDLVWIRATKGFGTPTEAELVLAEITGPGGPLRDLRVERNEAFGRTHFRFEGTADLSGGLEAFGDDSLAAALDGEALGQDSAAIEQELGQPLADMFSLAITADLPGDGSSGATWSPRLGGHPVAMEATGTVRHWPVVALAALATACAVALVALLLGWLTRRRGSPAGAR